MCKAQHVFHRMYILIASMDYPTPTACCFLMSFVTVVPDLLPLTVAWYFHWHLQPPLQVLSQKARGFEYSELLSPPIGVVPFDFRLIPAAFEVHNHLHLLLSYHGYFAKIADTLT